MSTTVDVHEAKTHLPELVDRASRGEEIVITEAGKPVARLVAATERPARREPGSAEGTLWISEDLDDPLPEEIQKYFEG